MAELLKGAPVAAALNEDLTRRIAGLKERGVTPALAIVRVGERPDDIAYENGAMNRCEKVGAEARRITLPAGVSQDELLETVRRLNGDAGVHGVLLLRPLPKELDEARICGSLAPEKDVDGITSGSMAGVYTGVHKGYPPCTPHACMELLDYYGVGLTGKRVVVVGRSLVVGKPAAMMLIRKNATVTVCHTRTENLPAVCRGAEILIVAIGRANAIHQDYLSPGQIVLDVGINVDENGKLCGDVDAAQADSIVKAFTPVPGGIGSVTTSVLVKHVTAAAEKAAGRG
ncbi:MAG: bifunctional 5,10-methylene-tetrahydrofolate dehydrogenase/5,10-methylene-tetrahydrofolate cyclohydrolase [Peptococcaceae bacterium]|jgi:methylenetetrahydrofolate dehydrogenase (NADP+)/methenyltetrahydrofolate cyclohydrolase|nr:bifunctional 5,10-methylene-tetrahydrofolate dehydrogenase/5,10-methylene-tetrahydrofolate cyclohydrolase [Peptococcaceae bacterium]